MSEDKKSGSTVSLRQKLNANEEMSETVQTEDDEGSGTKGSEKAQSQVELLDHTAYQKQIMEAEEKASQYWERMMRIQADMDNMQRRVERDVANAHKYALEKFVLELLPIIDNLERAIEAHSNEEAGTGSLLDGVNLILKMFNHALEKFHVQSVNPQNQAFNPEFHQAVSTLVDETVKPSTVLKVLQKGYLLNNRLIRPAMVIVSVEK